MPFVRPARETAKARRVDHLFATEAPQPQRTEAPAEPARPRDPAVVEGETQVRELLRRIEEFRARIPRPPEAASYEPSDAEDVLEQQPAVREHFSAAEEQIGSASCRERVCQYVLISVVAVTLKKKYDKNVKK